MPRSSAPALGELLREMRDGLHTGRADIIDFVNVRLRDYADRIEDAVRNATDKSVVRDWYINSVSQGDSPVWTDAHIDELFEDFYLVPRTKGGEIE